MYSVLQQGNAYNPAMMMQAIAQAQQDQTE
jgi:hypothetical protein